MTATKLASFPNSRIKPRPARTSGNTDILTLPAGVATLIVAANLNRTNVLIRNLDSVTNIYYGFTAAVNSSVGTNGGFQIKPGDVVNIDDPGNIYVYNDGVGAVNVSIDEGQG